MAYTCKICKKEVDITGCMECRENKERKPDFRFDSIKRK